MFSLSSENEWTDKVFSPTAALDSLTGIHCWSSLRSCCFRLVWSSRQRCSMARTGLIAAQQPIKKSMPLSSSLKTKWIAPNAQHLHPDELFNDHDAREPYEMACTIWNILKHSRVEVRWASAWSRRTRMQWRNASLTLRPAALWICPLLRRSIFVY